MTGEFRSSERITKPKEIERLTVSAVRERDGLTLIEFKGGRFLIVEATDGYSPFDGTVSAGEAFNFGLIGKAEFEAARAAEEAERVAATERYEREQYARLHAKFGGDLK